MNCFDARSLFVAFWRKALTDERRAQLLAHLRGCPACDHSFRIFALTAPLLYSAAEPDGNLAPEQPKRREASGSKLSSVDSRSGSQTFNRVLPAFIMAAAAVIALYFAVPPRMTFEDAVAASDNSNADVASYPATDSFLGQELTAQNPAPDLSDE
jgi:predicted anti-sigma-YlaC factor YlaD